MVRYRSLDIFYIDKYVNDQIFHQFAQTELNIS